MPPTLYRKYRPQHFAAVEGQTHVVQTLQGALSSGRLAHAYLFCGPRGTGKTSLARIFAKAINCADFSKISDGNLGQKSSVRRSLGEGGFIEPCNSCQSCTDINEARSLDLIEIDAASNRGIDEIRNLKESARVASAFSTYKIFLVDEVHMLTPPAFNALLKTLEEPPSHVVFILATTEPHKLPETILSRVQRFDFRKITVEQIAKKLEGIASQEKWTIDPAVFHTLAVQAGGSLRDAESALAKLAAYAGDKITLEQAEQILGLVSAQTHSDFLRALVAKQTQVALQQIGHLHDSGVDLENFTKQFVNHVRTHLIETVNRPTTNSASAPVLVEVLKVFLRAKSELRHSPIPQLPLELAVMELTHGK